MKIKGYIAFLLYADTPDTFYCLVEIGSNTYIWLRKICHVTLTVIYILFKCNKGFIYLADNK